MNIENFLFKGTSGIDLSGRIYRKNNDNTNGVIFSHGLFSSKDGYKITRMAETIVNTGCVLMTFNFRFTGESSENIADISILDEVEDLNCAIKFFQGKGIKKIHLMGSSLGAAVSILTASLKAFKIESMILIAAPLRFTGIFPGIKIQDLEHMDAYDTFDISGIKLKNGFLKELFNIDMIDAVKKIKCPSLLIHGKMDQVVDFSNLHTFINNSSCECTTLVIDDGDHNLTRDSDINCISLKVSEWLGKFNV